MRNVRFLEKLNLSSEEKKEYRIELIEKLKTINEPYDSLMVMGELNIYFIEINENNEIIVNMISKKV